jgi:serine/threonine-protein kinase
LVRGGWASEVYRAKDSRLDREVAIKVLSERLAKNAEALARFEREAKSVAAKSVTQHDDRKQYDVDCPF